MAELSFSKAIANKDALVAIGQTDVYLYGDNAKDVPWGQVTDIEVGSSCRLSGPASARMIAVVDGLKFSWSLDFEESGANGSSVSLFDRDGLREAMRKLPPKMRKKFGDLLLSEVLPPLQARTKEFREYLNKQIDSEDCLRGLIFFANDVT